MDHLPLVQAFKASSLPLNDPQSYRQITEIGRFTNDIRHVSGVDNIFADFLSCITEENKGSEFRDLPESSESDLVKQVSAAEQLSFQLVSLDALLSQVNKGTELLNVVYYNDREFEPE